MGKGGRKSRRATTWCKLFDTEEAADGCRKKANTKTLKDGMCIPCWQKKNAKALNHTKNILSFEGSKKILMELDVDEW